MSLRDASKKMSKSDVSDYSRVMLSDSEEEISLKIKKAKTDAEVFPDNKASAEKRKEVFNLMLEHLPAVRPELYALGKDSIMLVPHTMFEGDEWSTDLEKK